MRPTGARKTLREEVAALGLRVEHEVDKVAGGRELTARILLAAADRLDNSPDATFYHRGLRRRFKAHPSRLLRRLAHIALAREAKVKP